MLQACSNLGRIIKSGTRIKVICDRCRADKEFTPAEIEALAAKTSYRYSLVNRRCKCRLTPGCDGWNRFFYHWGVFRPMVTDRGVERQIERDRKARERISALAGKAREEGLGRKRR